GACPKCDGLGNVDFFDPERVVAHPDLSLASGAIRGWDRRNQFYFQLLMSLASHYGFDTETTFNELPEDIREVVLHGSGSEKISFRYLSDGGKAVLKEHAFEGIIPNLERRFKETDSLAVREELSKYRANRPCPACHGTRLRTESRFVLIGERNISEVSHLALAQCKAFFDGLTLSGQRGQVADKIVSEISSRLQFLINVGLDYLSLDRAADTLSGGEAQRIRLASQIGSGLTGVMYVLDEPSIGLHQRDNDRLLETLKRLRDMGNTVIVVEHDEDAIRMADYVVDMGPGAGEHGGQVIAEGRPEDIAAHPDSLTGAYLSGKRCIALPAKRHVPDPDKVLRIDTATGNNLKAVSVDIPVGLFTCVTGVSGSGKSTLINDTLYAHVARHVNGSSIEAAPCAGIEGLDHFDKVINVDQSPIGRTPRSNPATYTGLLTPIRDLFAGVPESKARGYNPGRFSFNVKGGRCEACQGDGLIKVEMHFLPDMYVPCDICHGKRYNRETLEIRYKGKNIYEVLDMTVEQALGYFSAVPIVARKLETLMQVGLGYIRLGQSATTLSGGEAQRVKLALELSKRDTGRTLYILDEPTTGLHFADIEMLLTVLHRLRDHGNTVVVIEHNLDVIKTADWLIDLGPEGGNGGGTIVGCGAPELIAANPASHTGKYLGKLLAPT
ncbi:excinuclease ABC subunit UvrA, partial [Zoogloea sp.]|uniref:excinuclease ABC subunit UvrA n=1 Tax=Zoogloea sp. TaxID=49181 RepID=UPI0025905815